jgi:hypothetical protein
MDACGAKVLHSAEARSLTRCCCTTFALRAIQTIERSSEEMCCTRGDLLQIAHSNTLARDHLLALRALIELRAVIKGIPR